ncbi:MAG: hypothetical protein LDL41_18950, partial [Coleofasciculus sp. S288]|nr:hypothetical protein [Coleofasciculus sp. S288]
KLSVGSYLRAYLYIESIHHLVISHRMKVGSRSRKVRSSRFAIGYACPGIRSLSTTVDATCAGR